MFHRRIAVLIRLQSRYQVYKSLLKPVKKSPNAIKSFQSTCLLGTVVYCSIQHKFPQFQNENIILNQPLIKLASVEVVNSATNLLTQLTVAILSCQGSYKVVLENLLVALEESVNPVGFQDNDELWDEIIALRSQLQEIKKQLNELELQLMSAEHLIDAVAQAAFSAGAEYAGIAANERLFSASQNIRDQREALLLLEKELTNKEKETITSATTDDQENDVQK